MDHETEKCKGCGADIIWIVDQDGVKLPVNKTRARAYAFDAVHAEWRYAEYDEDKKPALVFISHFITCPDRDKFRRSGISL